QDECKRLAAEVLAGTDKLDILVNNAGATWGEPLESFPTSAWDKVLDLNVKSPFWLVGGGHRRPDGDARCGGVGRWRQVGRHLAVRPRSVALDAHSASKAAVHQLTRVLAKELGPQHITVNAVAPGPFG
ncbi:SDR family NAD(P)-dependent oxidoreductase, partial [Mycolicibacterium gadium]|uniref:SDR family NAD(P)-dependent oxidoreductase n=1 Tax=Mycolicibacterium gadium TaxID=1794 RepID=UPI0021F382B4